MTTDNPKLGLVLGGLDDEPSEVEADDDDGAYAEAVEAFVEALSSQDTAEIGAALRAAIALAR
ncbi:MAG: hypothetical protein WC700_10405 [Gemmatimonadaceae bacterium]|jgi:hypothetical protein